MLENQEYKYYVLIPNPKTNSFHYLVKKNKMKKNHQISLQKAIEMTTLYRKNRPDNFPICETFDLLAIQSLIKNPECAFFRIYYGMDIETKVHAILVGADINGNDLLPTNSVRKDSDENEILEDAFRCPNVCPPDSPLNNP